ncbi:MAG: gliding motility protein GldN [Flavobacteriales bacterium]|nr:gliding motility protein GldN [Flavobacteriales bacterium]
MRALLCSTHVTLIAGSLLAQDAPSCRTNDVARPEPLLREADVMWCKRVWRTMDLADPANRSLAAGSDSSAACGSLFDVIRFCLTTDASMTAYDPGPTGADDRFTRAFRATELDSLLGHMEAAHIVGYRLKEDWIFEKQRSVLMVRIIGLAPLVAVRGGDGEFRGTREWCWLYWPECRKALAQWPVARALPEGGRPSYERLFAARRFTSTVAKVSNMYDRSLHHVLTGMDAVREAMRLERQLHDFERDLWHY